MKISILTLFPDMVRAVLGTSILGIAAEKGKVEYEVTDIRDFAAGKHRQVDDRPFGGGPGMVLMPGPVVEAVEHVRRGHEPHAVTVLLTPQGRPFDQAAAGDLAAKPGLILICGRYEGFDERVRETLSPLELSIGDFVLSGGELPALSVVEACVRLIPGVLGHPESAREDSFQGEGLLEGPQYTRPRVFRGLGVPDILLSGDHEAIASWRREQAQSRTRERREDLMEPRAG